jgi:hypothetical protein
MVYIREVRFRCSNCLPGATAIVRGIVFAIRSSSQTNQTEFIRLRNETIATQHTEKTAPSAPGLKNNLAATAASAGSHDALKSVGEPVGLQKCERDFL